MRVQNSLSALAANRRHTILSLVLLLLVACGGGSSGNSAAVLQSIAVSPASATPQPGATIQLAATGTYSDGTAQDVSSMVTWTSSENAVASISATGTVTAVAIGKTTITATIGAVAGQSTIVVTPPPGPALESVLYTFGTTSGEAQNPNPLIQASDGDFYISTLMGGANQSGCPPFPCGTVSRVTPTGVLTILYSFGGTSGIAAATPGPLIQARDGNLYGTAQVGGSHDACSVPHGYTCGSVYKISLDGVASLVYSFGASPTDGAYPAGPLVQAADGNFYGETQRGGASSCTGLPNDCGTAFMVTAAGDETVLQSFDTSGFWPTGYLIQATDGNFYGATIYGGNGYVEPSSCGGCVSGGGTIFKLTSAGVLTTLYSFGALQSDGLNPTGGLIQAADGNFYGMTSAGGANNKGTVFKITPAGVESILYSFGGSTSDGINPSGGLIQATDGNFYGVTAAGGSNGSGTVFMITPDGVETVLYSFGTSAADGATPLGPMIQASDGNFYGVTSSVFQNNGTGTVFKLIP